MEVRVYDKRQILRSFAGYLPLVIWATLIYVVFGVAGVAYILKSWFGIEKVSEIVVALVAVTVILGSVAYVYFVVKRISLSRLRLDNDTLVACGQTSWGLKERQWPLSEIVTITFGEELNAVERAGDWINRLRVARTSSITLLKDLKGGKMIISGTAGDKVVYNFIDKAFDSDSLREFTSELRRRGVVVRGPAYAVSIVPIPSNKDGEGSAASLASSDPQADTAAFNEWLQSSSVESAEQRNAESNARKSRKFWR